jgi:outer membrane receptor for ferrienterochelin and colicin
MPPCFLYAPGVAAPCRVPAHFRWCAITTLVSGAILAPALALAEETQRLSPIVVTAGGFEQDIEQAPASITVITREELETRAVTNLADALRLSTLVLCFCGGRS